jgi:hypothetical protein
MGRRRSGELPAMRHDERTGHARVRINGKTHWLGRWGLSELRDRSRSRAAGICNATFDVPTALRV